MAQQRIYEYDVSVTTPTQPTAGTPTLSSDLVPLSYLTANFSLKPKVSNSLASPATYLAAETVAHNLLATEFFGLLFVAGNGAARDLSSNPQIAVPTAIGQEITLVGCSATNTLTLEDGTGLELNGPITLGLKDMITLKALSLTTWTEKSRQ